MATMARGSLRVYLGAAPGVGKTYAMLNEGLRRRDRGTDVVVGWVETHGRSATAAQLRDLEVIAPKILVHRGQTLREMDVEVVLRRRPTVALVDELAHTNAPGSDNEKRWQDIERLLEAGVSVISTLNIQHLESLNDVVAAITGIPQRETVPDAFVRAAEQVELVDMTPEALRRRMAHGHVYPPERVDVALANYFRAGNLVALRELALLWVADNVEEQLQEYRRRHGIDGPWETRERVLVALTGARNGEHLIRRAARMARRAKGDLIAVHVRSDDGLRTLPPSHLDEQRALLARLGATYREVLGTDVADALVQVARAENATQIVLGVSHRSRWARLSTGSVVNSVIDKSGEALDVHVISPPARSEPDEPSGPGAGRGRWPSLHSIPRRRPHAMSRRRRTIGLLVAIVSLPLITLALASTRGDLPLGTVSLIYLLPVVTAAAVGGAAPGILAGIGGFLLLNWYFSPPIHTFTIADPRDIVALIVFVVIAAVVSTQVDLAARRSSEARRTRSQAAAMARAASALLEMPDPLPALVNEICRTFAVDGVAVLHGGEHGWVPEVASGTHPPSLPEEATLTLPVGPDRLLALASGQLRADDREALGIFVTQIAVAVANRQLQAQAAEAAALAKANEVRTALLAAVSHDLRTPLASIKAAATSFLPGDVAWEPAAVRAQLETIDTEADRLTALVANLLDMSRLHTGALVVHLAHVGLDEVVSAALISVPVGDHLLEVFVPETLPGVEADPPLLERALANLLANALSVSNPETPIRVMAGIQPGGWMELRIVDRGPGIAPVDRERIFLPFQRLGDQKSASGVGLGLAVAKGFVEAMGGELTVEDTPGGGATMIVRLRIVDPAGGHGGDAAHVRRRMPAEPGSSGSSDGGTSRAVTEDAGQVDGTEPMAPSGHHR
jgi:two-component system sensor histidine kinase KdpD